MKAVADDDHLSPISRLLPNDPFDFTFDITPGHIMYPVHTYPSRPFYTL